MKVTFYNAFDDVNTVTIFYSQFTFSLFLMVKKLPQEYISREFRGFVKIRLHSLLYPVYLPPSYTKATKSFDHPDTPNKRALLSCVHFVHRQNNVMIRIILHEKVSTHTHVRKLAAFPHLFNHQVSQYVKRFQKLHANFFFLPPYPSRFFSIMKQKISNTLLENIIFTPI